MKVKFAIIIFFLVLFPWIRGFAQADISMATHWYNRANYNPASIARTEYIYLFSKYPAAMDGNKRCTTGV